MRLAVIAVVAALQVSPEASFDRRLGAAVVNGDTVCVALNDPALFARDSHTIPTVVLFELDGSGRSFPVLAERAHTDECTGLSGFAAYYTARFVWEERPTATLLGAASGVFRLVPQPDGSMRFRIYPAPTPHLLGFSGCSTEHGSTLRVASASPAAGTVVWSKDVAAQAGLAQCR